MNRRVGRTQLGEVRLGAKPDYLCLVGVELQATASAPDLRRQCRTRSETGEIEAS